MALHPSRRDFLKTSTTLAGASAAWWITGTQQQAAARSLLEKVNFACIGVGGKGRVDTTNAGKWGNIVALCDIDANSLNGMAGNFKSAAKYADYRKMFDEVGEKIDAVTVVVPDHSHAAASVMAMRLKKHVYCQKPLTWSIQEARAMREIAHEYGVKTQMGNQGTSHDGLREAAEVIRAGALGTVKEVHVWTNRPIWAQGTGRPAPQEPPANVNWDLFLGPAPERPYSPAYHPFNWRGWLDFGTGALGDMACHTANMAVMALNLFDPTRVSAESSGIVENETYPKWSQIEFDFPANANRGPVKMYWYDGGKLPNPELLHGRKMSDSGSCVVGDKGTLYSPDDYGARYFLLPKEKYADYEKPEQSIPRCAVTGGDEDYKQMGELVNAIGGGPDAMSNFNYAARLTETILLGNVALRAGQPIEWDAKAMKVTNMPEANQLLGREYRPGWTL